MQKLGDDSGHWLSILSNTQVNVWQQVSLEFWNASQSCSVTGLNDTPCQMCQRGKFISSHWERHRLSCPEPRQVIDWIYSSLDKTCVHTCTKTAAHAYKSHTLLFTSVCILLRCTCRHSIHRCTACLSTHLVWKLVTRYRHCDSLVQMQWFIVSSCMDWGKESKTRRWYCDKCPDIYQTSVCAYFRSERWVSSNPYFRGGKWIRTDRRCLVEKLQPPNYCFILCSAWSSFQKQMLM